MTPPPSHRLKGVLIMSKQTYCHECPMIWKCQKSTRAVRECNRHIELARQHEQEKLDDVTALQNILARYVRR